MRAKKFSRACVCSFVRQFLFLQFYFLRTKTETDTGCFCLGSFALRPTQTSCDGRLTEKRGFLSLVRRSLILCVQRRKERKRWSDILFRARPKKTFSRREREREAYFPRTLSLSLSFSLSLSLSLFQRSRRKGEKLTENVSIVWLAGQKRKKGLRRGKKNAGLSFSSLQDFFPSAMHL